MTDSENNIGYKNTNTFRSYGALTRPERELVDQFVDQCIRHPHSENENAIERHIAKLAEHGLLNVVKYNKGFLSDQENEGSLLDQAIDAKCEDVALALIRHGALLKEAHGCWPLLHNALSKKLQNVASELIKRGAPLNQSYGIHGTPLTVALKMDLEDLAMDMIKRGALLNESNDKYKKTPLHIALEKGFEDIALEMIERGAPLNAIDFGDNTPLHIAMKHGLERAALAMIKRGANTEAVNKEGYSPYREQFTTMLALSNAFVRHCIMPACMLEGMNPPPPLEKLREIVNTTFMSYPEAPMSQQELTALNEHSSFIQEYFRPMRLGRTFLHPSINFPQELLPLRKPLSWKPLLPEEVLLSDGTRVQCLTSTQQLKDMQGKFNNCLGKGDYDLRCCSQNPAERSHILMLTNPDGTPLSLLEVRIAKSSASDRDKRATIHGRQLDVYVHQHEAINRGTQVNTPPSERAMRAWKEFAARVESGTVSIADLRKLGETEESKNSPANPLLEIMGYEPEWRHADLCFNVFRSPAWRATLFQPEERRRIYDDTKTPEGYDSKSHFIQGYALVDVTSRGELMPTGKWALHSDALTPEKGQKIVDLRRLTLKGWLQATGIMDKIRQAAVRSNGNREKTPLVEIPPVTETRLEELTNYRIAQERKHKNNVTFVHTR